MPSPSLARQRFELVRVPEQCWLSTGMPEEDPITRQSFVLTFLELVNRCTEQTLEKHIAVVTIEVANVRDSVLELDVAFHSQFASDRCGGPRKIRLDGTGDQNGVGTLLECRTEMELQLPHLVPAESDARVAISFDKEG